MNRLHFKKTTGDFMNCKKCGFENEDGAKFCGKCGSPLIAETKVCESCGSPLSEEAKFCVNCGSPSESQKTATPTEDTATQKESEAETQPQKAEALSPEEIQNLPNSNQEVTKHMTKAFNEKNKSETELTAEEKEKLRLEYFKSIEKNPNMKNEIYDPKLVDINNKGVVTDKNDPNVLMTEALTYWAIAGGAVLFLIFLMFLRATIGYGLIGTAIFIFEMLTCGAIFVLVILNIGEFISALRSSRDSKFKLKSTTHVFPIVLLLAASIIFLGIQTTISLIIGFVVLGTIGFVCMLLWGR